MYKLECRKKYTLKLNIPDYIVRFNKLVLENSNNNIIYIKEEFDNSTFRYRCYNFIQAMKSSKKYRIECFLSSEIPSLLKIIDKIKVVVFQRATWNNNVQNLILLCKQKRIPVVYDIDDLIYKYDYVPDYLDNIGVSDDINNIRFYMGVSSGLELVAKQCDYFICTTGFLKEYLMKDFQKPCCVVPNFYNIEQEEESEYILDTRVRDKSKFIIGYFSGSPSHLNDFRVCKKDLIKLLNKYDDVYLKIVGYMNLDKDMMDLYNKGKILVKPFCSYQELQYEVAEVDINVAPLYDYYFNYAKSELKYFEAALVKVPSVVSNVGIYKEVINDKVNGFLCDQGVWYHILEDLYLNEEKRYKISETAYKEVKNIYNLNEMRKQIEKTFDSILNESKVK